MNDAKRINGALWGVNGLLGLAILLFSWKYLLAYEGKYLQDHRRDEQTGPAGPVRSQDPGDGPLKTLPNPVEKKIAVGEARAIVHLQVALKGTLPAGKDPKTGVAFLKLLSKNLELVAYTGEEILHEGKVLEETRGWTLQEVSKDSARFKCTDGREQLLQIEQIAGAAPGPQGGPAGPGGQPKVSRIGQAYSSGDYKSRLLASADSRQVWGLDPDEIDWATQNSDRIMEQDFQVTPYAGGGLRVENVNPSSIGASRGLQAGDVIREVNGQPLTSINDVRTLLNNPAMRQQVGMRISIERAGKPIVIEYRPLPRQ